MTVRELIDRLQRANADNLPVWVSAFVDETKFQTFTSVELTYKKEDRFEIVV